MRRYHALAFVLTLVLGISIAQADVAVLNSTSGNPSAGGAEDGSTAIAFEDLGGTVPARMVAEYVDIHLYPGIVVVDARFSMLAEANIEDALFAFPEELGQPQTRSGPLLAPLVELDGEPVELVHGGRWKKHCRAIDDRWGSWQEETWWAWRANASAGQAFEIRVRYAQQASARYPGTFTYVLRSGASWLGPIGHGELQFHLHGVAPESVMIAWPGIPLQQDNPEPQLSWSFDNLEPEEDVRFLYSFVDEAYDPIADPIVPEPDLDAARAAVPDESVHGLLTRITLVMLSDDREASMREWRLILDEFERMVEHGSAREQEYAAGIRLAIADQVVRNNFPDEDEPMEEPIEAEPQPDVLVEDGWWWTDETRRTVALLGGQAHLDLHSSWCDRPRSNECPGEATAPLDAACLVELRNFDTNDGSLLALVHVATQDYHRRIAALVGAGVALVFGAGFWAVRRRRARVKSG